MNVLWIIPGSGDDPQSLPLPKLRAKLGTPAEGLSQAEVRRRLEQYGYNEISEKEASTLLKLLTCFWGPISWIIEA